MRRSGAAQMHAGAGAHAIGRRNSYADISVIELCGWSCDHADMRIIPPGRRGLLIALTS